MKPIWIVDDDHSIRFVLDKALTREQFQTVMRREMSLDMSKEEVLAAAAREIKLAEFQQGKVLMDVFGQRVRLEEYIIRPRADQFKLVVLNERQSRFDYFYYLGTFNTALPTDMSVALRQLSGSVGTAPTFWLTGFETGRYLKTGGASHAKMLVSIAEALGVPTASFGDASHGSGPLAGL